MRCTRPKSRSRRGALVAVGLIFALTILGLWLRTRGLSSEAFEVGYAILLAAVGGGFAVCAGGGGCRSRAARRDPTPAADAGDSDPIRHWPRPEDPT